MAFDELPQIDLASKNDDEAKTKFSELFGQHAGFISRSKIRDKCCDYQIELIHESKNATHWHFGVQLKSIESPDLIDNGEFISYPILTSRLQSFVLKNKKSGLISIQSPNMEVLLTSWGY